MGSDVDECALLIDPHRFCDSVEDVRIVTPLNPDRFANGVELLMDRLVVVKFRFGAHRSVGVRDGGGGADRLLRGK